MRVTSNNPRGRLSPIPASRREAGLPAAGGAIRCRVMRRQVTDRAAGKPDWNKIPTRRKLPLTEGDWAALIGDQAARDAAHGRALSGQAERLLVEYVSQISPDRRRMYEILFRQYGDRLEGYSASDGSNMRNVDGLWEYELTKQESRMVDGFMQIYIPAFESVRGKRLAGRHLFREV